MKKFKKKLKIWLGKKGFLFKDDKEEILENFKYQIENNKNAILKLEKDWYQTFKLFEYNFYDLNKSNNILLYENELLLSELKGKVIKTFKPMVSIIIPAYNASNYLKESINSALNQTYKNIEIIVVNDGSDDNGKTKEIALSYGNKIRYFEKENGGVSSALNLGIKNMKGEYFSWLSHDDLYLPNNIAEHIKYLSHVNKEKIITYTSFYIIDENSNKKINDTIISSFYLFDYKVSRTNCLKQFIQGEINGGSILIPKKAFDKYGLFDEKDRISQERDMWSRLIEDYHFTNIPYELTAIRSHNSQITKTSDNIKEKTNEKIINICKKIIKSDDFKEYDSKQNFLNELKVKLSYENRQELAELIIKLEGDKK